MQVHSSSVSMAFAATAAACALACAGVASAQVVAPTQKIEPQEVANWFGTVLSADDDVSVIGSFFTNGGGVTDAAVIHYRDAANPHAWERFTHLVPVHPPIYGGLPIFGNQRFGNSNAIDGDTVVVGAYFYTPEEFWVEGALIQGAAYIFERDAGGVENWGQVKHLLASDATEEARFGRSVAIDGDRIAVGAEEASGELGDRIGGVYIFERDHGGADNWGEVIKIEPPTSYFVQRFGITVALDGDYLLVGKPNATSGGGGVPSNAAHLYHRDQGGPGAWGLLATITPPGGVDDWFFGIRVAIEGDTMVVASDSQVVIYLRDEVDHSVWTHSTTFSAQNISDGPAFSLQGDLLLIGHAWPWPPRQSVLLKRHHGGTDNWGEVARLAVGGLGPEGYGVRAVLTGVTAIVGLRSDPGSPGAAYSYQSFQPADLNQDGAVNGSDLGILLLAWGTDDPAADLNADGVVDGTDLGLLLLAWTSP